MGALIETLNMAVIHVCQLLAIVVISVGIVMTISLFFRGILPGSDYAATPPLPGLLLLAGARFPHRRQHPQDGRHPHLERHRPAGGHHRLRTVLNYFLLRDIESHQPIINQPLRSGLRLTLLERR